MYSWDIDIGPYYRAFDRVTHKELLSIFQDLQGRGWRVGFRQERSSYLYPHIEAAKQEAARFLGLDVEDLDFVKL